MKRLIGRYIFALVVFVYATVSFLKLRKKKVEYEEDFELFV